MQPKNLNNQQLEQVYDQLAESLDAMGEEQQLLFLSKLALLSANAINNTELFSELIESAKQDLGPGQS